MDLPAGADVDEVNVLKLAELLPVGEDLRRVLAGRDDPRRCVVEQILALIRDSDDYRCNHTQRSEMSLGGQVKLR